MSVSSYHFILFVCFASSLWPFRNIVEETTHSLRTRINMPHILQCHLHSSLCKSTANSKLSQLFTMRDKRSALFYFCNSFVKIFYLLRQFLAYIYFNKFPIARVFDILYTIRNGEPA